MTVKTVNLDDGLISAAEVRARELSEEYGVTVSFSEVVRRALSSFLSSSRSTSRPLSQEEIIQPVEKVAA